MKSVFVVPHLHRLPQDEDSVTVIGVDRSRVVAVQVVESSALQPGVSDFSKMVDPENDDVERFHLSEYELGKDRRIGRYLSVTS